jgi:hypothetical protein
MGIHKEIWTDYIIGNLYKKDEFLSKAFDESDEVLGGKVVHIAQAGSKPEVILDRSTLPATAQERADSDITYTLGWYSVTPERIRNAEQAELSYDKMDSILGEFMSALRNRLGDEMAIKWLTNAVAASNVIRTTGSATAATEGGQTGNRKAMNLATLRKAKLAFNKADIPKEDRYIVLESNMLGQLEDDLIANSNRDFSKMYDAEKGVVAQLESFNIMERSDVAMANVGASALNAYGAATQADDNVVAMAFQKYNVARAEGEVNIFHTEQDATHYGDILSMDVRAGGRARRTGAQGVLAIVQDTAA